MKKMLMVILFAMVSVFGSPFEVGVELGLNNSNIFIDDTNETCIRGSNLCTQPAYGTYDRTGEKLLQSL